MNKIYWGSHANILKSVINNISNFSHAIFETRTFFIAGIPTYFGTD